MPSANPASGPHPHAPGAPTGGPHLTGALQPSKGLVGAPGASGRGGVDGHLSEARRAELRAQLNTRYCSTVQAGEADELEALLGREHIFKCFAV